MLACIVKKDLVVSKSSAIVVSFVEMAARISHCIILESCRL